MAYAESNGFDPALLEVVVPLRKLVIYFAVHLRETRFPRPGVPIKSVTIDQYITHVADYLVTHEITRDGTDLRSRRLTMLLAGYQIADYLGLPMRLTQKIPMTYVLACQMYQMVDMVVRDAPGRRALRAAIAVGYGLSLRPGEYLDDGTPKSIASQLNASNCFFAFGEEVIVCVCDPHLYPPNELPTAFFTLLDTSKNQRRGEGGPRAMSVAKDAHTDERFGCVQAVWSYFTAHPGVRETLALSSHGETVRWSDIRQLCFMVAKKNGLDPSRFVPHSFRSGAQAQMELAADERKRQQGGWLSDGFRTYARKALHHAYAIADELHDPKACPLAQTVVLFGDLSEGAVYYAAREVEIYLGLEKNSCEGM